MIQMLITVMELFKGPYFSVGAASRHFWPNSAIVNGTMHIPVFVIYEFFFTCFMVECKRSYIFQISSDEMIIEIYGL